MKIGSLGPFGIFFGYPSRATTSRPVFRRPFLKDVFEEEKILTGPTWGRNPYNEDIFEEETIEYEYDRPAWSSNPYYDDTIDETIEIYDY